MWEIWANLLLLRALKSCPKSNKSPDLVRLLWILINKGKFSSSHWYRLCLQFDVFNRCAATRRWSSSRCARLWSPSWPDESWWDAPKAKLNVEYIRMSSIKCRRGIVCGSPNYYWLHWMCAAFSLRKIILSRVQAIWKKTDFNQAVANLIKPLRS